VRTPEEVLAEFDWGKYWGDVVEMSKKLEKKEFWKLNLRTAARRSAEKVKTMCEIDLLNVPIGSSLQDKIAFVNVGLNLVSERDVRDEASFFAHVEFSKIVMAYTFIHEITTKWLLAGGRPEDNFGKLVKVAEELAAAQTG
jgi:hypothetical protein